MFLKIQIDTRLSLVIREIHLLTKFHLKGGVFFVYISEEFHARVSPKFTQRNKVLGAFTTTSEQLPAFLKVFAHMLIQAKTSTRQ